MGKLLDTVHGVKIRLPAERWQHVASRHPELTALEDDIALALAEPEMVVEGPGGEYLALRKLDSAKWLVVVYRLTGRNGFVITAFVTRRRQYFERWRQVWP
jgi:hypothetical protein